MIDRVKDILHTGPLTGNIFEEELPLFGVRAVIKNAHLSEHAPDKYLGTWLLGSFLSKKLLMRTFVFVNKEDCLG